MELKKSYKGFIIWMIFYIVVCGLITIIPVNSDLSVLIVMNGTTLSIVILCAIIYLTESVYWYNGVSYEQALEAGSDRRKSYALKHLIRFGIFEIIFLIYSVFALFFSFAGYVHAMIVCVGLVAVAINTLKIRL